jgi:hypothetical protein
VEHEMMTLGKKIRTFLEKFVSKLPYPARKKRALGKTRRVFTC